MHRLDEDGFDKDGSDDSFLGMIDLEHNSLEKKDTTRVGNEGTSAGDTVTAAPTMSISHIMNG